MHPHERYIEEMSIRVHLGSQSESFATQEKQRNLDYKSNHISIGKEKLTKTFTSTIKISLILKSHNLCLRKANSRS